MSRLGTGELNGLGERMLGFMTPRGIYTWKGLSERIYEKTGRRYKPARISNWAYGRHPANLQFGRDFIEALDLGERESKVWKNSFLMEQGSASEPAATLRTQ